MNTTTQSTTPDAISVRAYQLWESAGRPEGRDQEFWLLAEQELKVKPLSSSSTVAAGNGTPRSRTAREKRGVR